MSILQIDLSQPKPDETQCKGLFFRGVVNNYLSGSEFVSTKRMRPLKRMSCKGCEKCAWMLEQLPEFINTDYAPDISDTVNGALYQLKVGNISKDWETGYIDDYEFIFTEVIIP